MSPLIFCLWMLFVYERNKQEFSSLSYLFAVKFIRETHAYHVYFEKKQRFTKWSWMPPVATKFSQVKNLFCYNSTTRRCPIPIVIHFNSNPNVINEQLLNFACPMDRPFYQMWEEETHESKQNENIQFYVYKHVPVIVHSELILSYIQNEDRVFVIDVNDIIRQKKDGLCYLNLCGSIYPNEPHVDENIEDDRKGKIKVLFLLQSMQQNSFTIVFLN